MPTATPTSRCRPPASGCGTTPGRRSATDDLPARVERPRGARDAVAGAVLPRRLLRRRRGGAGQRDRALPAGPALEPVHLERRLRRAGGPGRAARRALVGRVRAHAALRLRRGLPVAGHRLPGGLLRVAPRRALEGAAAGPARAPVLDLVSDADV